MGVVIYFKPFHTQTDFTKQKLNLDQIGINVYRQKKKSQYKYSS